MGYNVSLCEPDTGQTIRSMIPTSQFAYNEMRLNITDSYSKYFCRAFGEEGLQVINGKTGAESIPILIEAALSLKQDVSEGRWSLTENNARETLFALVVIASQRLDGIWYVPSSIPGSSSSINSF